MSGFVFLHLVWGLLLGSFLGVVVLRLISNESGIFFGRSHCTHCDHALAPIDLIPIFSFFSTQGKCRYCHAKLSWFYPAIELTTGVLFALAAYHSSALFPTLWLELVFALFVILAFFDLRTHSLPDILSYIGLALAWVANLLGFGVDLLSGIYGLLVFLVFFGAQIIISRGKWLGTGDLFLGVFLGSLVGWVGALFTLFVAYAIGSAVGITLLLTHRAKRETALPFAPFLVLGTTIFLLWGEGLIHLYRFYILGI